ncbi:CRISPR-associated endoribonuclease Cas6 [Clostridium sp. CF011]|uniref:CRISPR-associated endoribonuclease Cas6 n=1 Tax=Clostridium sp. CF011 TaxID=2843318 RepID=UPI001C0DE0FC|nr:CRISPR-associated endoribonuclease Cas6 [Clostridium sp. CF011]MBU3092742.1 CRISPR-associated endoribonuclease Cas6 [Clostridium sp. CF011]WAG71163.1 CRISPR-associated endoribonuclease Cas6 [Clostridium sp. CF011]
MGSKKYYEIEVSLYTNNDIHSSDMYEKLSRFINFSFHNSQMLSSLHKTTDFKHYSFSGLYPIEKDNIYKADEIYSFLFRSYKKGIIEEVATAIKGLKNYDFIVTNIKTKDWEHRDIKYIDNLTPAVITLKDGMRWNKDTHGVGIAKESIFKNLMRKYNSLNSTKFELNYEDIIKDIAVKSKCAIILNYKGIKILGYKFRVEFQENSIAQEIANLAVAEGIGEKNSSFGMGFVKPYFR